MLRTKKKGVFKRSDWGEVGQRLSGCTFKHYHNFITKEAIKYTIHKLTLETSLDKNLTRTFKKEMSLDKSIIPRSNSG